MLFFLGVPDIKRETSDIKTKDQHEKVELHGIRNICSKLSLDEDVTTEDIKRGKKSSGIFESYGG